MNLIEDFQKIDSDYEGKLMFELTERLYPICRSITGNGVRETLSIFKNLFLLKERKFPQEQRFLIGRFRMNGTLKMHG